MDDNCIFCKIAAGTIPARKVYEDELVVAFNDLHPQAPVHILVIPRQHLACLDDLGEAERPVAGYLLERVAAVARLAEVAAAGYRTIINTRQNGGQEVAHLHVHILGGAPIGPLVARRQGGSAG